MPRERKYCSICDSPLRWVRKTTNALGWSMSIYKCTGCGSRESIEKPSEPLQRVSVFSLIGNKDVQ